MDNINIKIDEYENEPSQEKYMELVVLIHNLPERRQKKLLRDLLADYSAEMFDIEYSDPQDFLILQKRLEMLLDAGIRLGTLDPEFVIPPEFIMWQNKHDQKLMNQVRQIETMNRLYSTLSQDIMSSSRINTGVSGSRVMPYLEVTKRIPSYRKIKEADPRKYSLFKFRSKSKGADKGVKKGVGKGVKKSVGKGVKKSKRSC